MPTPKTPGRRRFRRNPFLEVNNIERWNSTPNSVNSGWLKGGVSLKVAPRAVSRPCWAGNGRGQKGTTTPLQGGSPQKTFLPNSEKRGEVTQKKGFDFPQKITGATEAGPLTSARRQD